MPDERAAIILQLGHTGARRDPGFQPRLPSVSPLGLDLSGQPLGKQLTESARLAKVPASAAAHRIPWPVTLRMEDGFYSDRTDFA